MDETSTLSTWHALQSFGFVPDPDLISDVSPGLRYTFKELELTAIVGLNRQLQQVVMLGAILQTSRTCGEVAFEMPMRVDSLAQCAAWIAWHLDQGLLDHERLQAGWLSYGRNNLGTLPWPAN